MMNENNNESSVATDFDNGSSTIIDAGTGTGIGGADAEDADGAVVSAESDQNQSFMMNESSRSKNYDYDNGNGGNENNNESSTIDAGTGTGTVSADADADGAVSAELVVMENSIKEGGFHNDDISDSDDDDDDDDDDVDDDDIIKKGGDTDESDGDGDGTRGTYPADCYSFLALYSPFTHFGFWSFGVMVWAFQIAFLILLVLRVASKRHSTNEDSGNPGGDFFADFIPANVPALARATQFFAILSYCIFADESIKDVVTAVETFPKFNKAKPNDKVWCMVFSCTLRFIQGMLACLVVLLLVINTTDVVDIVLNFTAVNFISAFDDVAFELAQWGKYGPALEKEANRIEELPVPACIYRKYQHVRYRFTVIPIAFILLSCITIIAIRQDSRDSWITKVLRVQYDGESSYNTYSGCYRISTDIAKQDKRYVYEGDEYNVDEAKFGYCKEDRKWFLFKGNITSACEAEDIDVLAYSDRTYDFDISVTFEETWYSRTGTPLEMYFFDDEDSLDAELCSSFLGDGVCNEDFNIPSYNYDEGDCCAATCDASPCGVGTMRNAFDTEIANGDGYPTCKDPSQKATTIRINSVYLVEEELEFGVVVDDVFSNLEPRDPLLILDCDGSNVLTVNVVPMMENRTETIFVNDGAECSVLIKNRTSGGRDIYYVNYTVFHGDEASIDDAPIVIMDANSYEDGRVYFQRIPTCFFSKLSNYIDNTTIYTASDSPNKAVTWLLEDPSGFSSCENEFFVERYSLVVLNFAAPIDLSLTDPTYNETSSEKLFSDSLWIRNERQCAWTNVACTDGSVVELDVGGIGLGKSLFGTIPTEIGLLKNLTRIDMSANYLFGTIPSGIGLWPSINYIAIGSNSLTGKIPTEIGLMNLTWFFAEFNELTETIPNEIGQLTNLKGFLVYDNDLTGTLPSELGKATALEYLIVSFNSFEGTIPPELGQLEELKYLGLDNDGLNGTIPSSLSKLNNVTYLELQGNALTGSVPLEIAQTKTYDNFNVYDNELSGLKTVVGLAICTRIGNSTGEVEGEHYCNCGSDCLAEYGQRCECEEAQACCDIYIEKNNITNCVACEAELEFSNPEFEVEDWGYASCSDAATYMYIELEQFGTEEQCDEVKKEANKQGCSCPGYVVPSKDEDDVQI